MIINIITIGKPDCEYLKIIEKYLKKLKHLTKINFLPQKDIKLKDPKIKLKKEEKLLISQVNNGLLCILDQNGKAFNSIEFSNFIKQNYESNKNINFVIGGAIGISEEFKNKADLILKISDFTFQHDLALLVLLEQLYRSFTIIYNIPYHK